MYSGVKGNGNGRKINLSSPWPTLYASWRRGLSILGGDTNFDLMQAGIDYTIPMKLLGRSKIILKAGMFLNVKQLLIVFKFSKMIFVAQRSYDRKNIF